MDWPTELRMAAIVWEVKSPIGTDIFVADDPPGEFEDEAFYVRREQLEAAESRCKELEEILGELIVGVGMEQDGLATLVASAQPERIDANLRDCLNSTDLNLGRLLDKARTALKEGE